VEDEEAKLMVDEEDVEDADKEEQVVTEPDFNLVMNSFAESDDAEEEDEEGRVALGGPAAWREIPTLPAGWMYRAVEGGGVVGRLMGTDKRQFLLAPTGSIFPCRRLALRHMIETGYPAKEVITW
jgi:hypothetical protein